jgi:hypothetical protein
MKTLRLVVVAASLLLFPMTSAAGVITFEISDGGELAVEFGKSLAQISADAQGDVAQGTFDLQSPFIGCCYDYGAGTLTMALRVFNPNGSDVDGTFTAVVQPFTIDVTELRECEEEEEADDCEDPDFPGSTARDFWITLGPGMFDPQSAKILGIRPNTLGGEMLLGLEGIDGGPASQSRTGFDYRGFTELTIVTEEAVPEPSLLLMLAAGGAAISGRRGISRARSSAPRSENP